MIGIVGDEISFGNEIFFDLSKLVKPAIAVIKNKGIERFVFMRGIEDDELAQFIGFLAARPDPTLTLSVDEQIARLGLRHISAGKLKVNDPGSGQDEREKVPGSPAEAYESALKTATASITDILNTEAVDHLAIRFALHNVMQNIAEHHQDFMKIVTIRRYDQDTFAHLLNVAILAMYFSSRAGFSQEDILDIGTAGLFHDIGKMYISRKLLRKVEKLTDEEFAAIRNHAMFGAEIMLKHIETMGLMPVVVAFEHHLKYDLSGYPKSPYNRTIHTASAIVCICDVYDALNQRRSYKSDYAPDTVYNIMLKDRGKAFDPLLFDAYFRFIGVWPIGVVLELNDGRIVVVRDENDDDITAPIVEVIKPIERRELLNLKEHKDTLSVARFLNPWKEGKELLSLI